MQIKYIPSKKNPRVLEDDNQSEQQQDNLQKMTSVGIMQKNHILHFHSFYLKNIFRHSKNICSYIISCWTHSTLKKKYSSYEHAFFFINQNICFSRPELSIQGSIVICNLLLLANQVRLNLALSLERVQLCLVSFLSRDGWQWPKGCQWGMRRSSFPQVALSL